METIEEKKKKKAAKKKKVTEKKAHSAAIKKKAKAREAKKRAAKGWFVGEVMAIRAAHPEFTQQDIADRMGEEVGRVSSALRSRIARSSIQAIEANELQFLKNVRTKALALLDAVLDNPDEPMHLRQSIARFVLKPTMEEKIEVDPHTLIFETVIGSSGQVTKNVRKLFEGDFPKDVTPT